MSIAPTLSVVSRSPWSIVRGFAVTAYSAYLWAKQRADERTRTADLISLRVCGQWLLGIAEACKHCITKPVCFLWLAACCSAMVSRMVSNRPPPSTVFKHLRLCSPPVTDQDSANAEARLLRASSRRSRRPASTRPRSRLFCRVLFGFHLSPLCEAGQLPCKPP